MFKIEDDHEDYCCLEIIDNLRSENIRMSDRLASRDAFLYNNCAKEWAEYVTSGRSIYNTNNEVHEYFCNYLATVRALNVEIDKLKSAISIHKLNSKEYGPNQAFNEKLWEVFNV